MLKGIMPKILLVLLALPPLALAQDKTESSASVYAPDFCDFTATFPKEPYVTRQCEGDNKDRCFDLVSYTQVFGLSSTVNFRVICNPIDAQVFSAYTPEVMQATLRAMTRGSVAKEFDASFREEETYKQAGLVGEGLSGQTATIYIAQLWIGQNSALSVEAQLIGEAYEEADTLFSDILKSVGLKASPEETKDTPETDDAQDE